MMNFQRLFRFCIFLCAVAYGQQRHAWAQEDSNFDIAGLQAIRGVVSAVKGEQVLVKTRNGTVYTVDTGANTHFVKDAQQAQPGVAKVGDTVLAGGELDEKKHELGAIFLAVVDAQELAELDKRETQWGKTWMAGTVEAKHGVELTVKRPDGVTNTVVVNEDTSFRRRHQSITLPDIAVGDGMTATGEMQGNRFTAKVLTVVDAAEIREWNRLRGQVSGK